MIRVGIGESSLGVVLITCSDIVGIRGISFLDTEDIKKYSGNPNFTLDQSVISKVIALIENPSCGIDYTLEMMGTGFQNTVWQELQKIPAGQTRSYKDVAVALGRPTATRAVAKACASNRIAVAIPCHRVLASSGALSGYAWGVERKRALLNREKA